MRIGDFEVRKTGKDTCSVVQYKGEDRDIVIPPAFEKYRPTAIEATLIKKGLRPVSITIPPSVDEIAEGLFPTLKTLERFEVGKGSLSFRSESGVLYDSSFYSLIFYPPKKEGEEFVSPKRLGRVARTAFCCTVHFRRFVYSSKLEEFQALPSECPDLELFVPSEDAEDYDLSEQIRQCSIMLSKAWTDKKIEFTGSFEKCRIHASKGLLQHVWINILDNAIKYTPAGSEIKITAEKKDNSVLVSIADNGAGIPDRIKPRVFEMFFTGDNKIADSRRSLGLGLSLCKSIINAHGSEITLTDNIPHGAVFTFSLPSGEVNINE